jgi:hypothetical protein
MLAADPPRYQLLHPPRHLDGLCRHLPMVDFDCSLESDLSLTTRRWLSSLIKVYELSNLAYVDLFASRFP